MIAHSVGLAVWVGLSAMGAAPAAAPPPAGHDEPWAKVTPEHQQAAMKLFEQANQEVLDTQLPQAINHYRQALEHWDHPGIHYNLAVALLNLANPLESHKHLEAALRYGPEPLGAMEKFQRARSLLTTVESELSKLVLTCTEPGAKVTVDDRKDLFVCPRVYGEWTTPGRHFIRISLAKSQYSHPTDKTPTLQKGEKLSLQLNVYPDDRWIETRRPWPEWVPWSVIAAGAAVVGGGVFLHVQAAGAFKAYDDRIAACAGSPPAVAGQIYAPCSADESQGISADRQRGSSLQTLAIGSYVGAGAAMAAGAVLIYLNNPRSYPANPDAAASGGAQLSIAPVLAPGSGGAVLTFSF
ncbi:MAG TPA: hypothetical protein VND93_01445 [Myxococcales bacterium]|jgi:hypothetical protein|nr:hypothetical protein [Myxococcales bacterium]